MENWRAIISRDGIIRSSFPAVPIPDETITEFIWSRAMKHPEHQTALTCGATGRSYSFKDARTISLRFGAALLKKGYGPGDILAIMMPNNIEYSLIALGALEAGLLITTVDSTTKRNELIYQMQMTGPKVIVTVAVLVPLITEVLKSHGIFIRIIIVDSYAKKTSPGMAADLWNFYDMIDNDNQSENTVKVSPETLALLPASSGTTGTMKIVARTHKHVLATIVVPYQARIALCESRPTVTELTDREVQVVATPFHHTVALWVVFTELVAGSHIIVVPFQEPQTLINVISKQKPLTVTLNCYPAAIVDLNPHVKTDDLRSLRTVKCSGSPVMPSHIRKFLDKLPKREDVKFKNVYGLTEAHATFLPVPDHPNPKAVGYPMPNVEIKVVDSMGNSLGPGEEGEIYVRGPQVVKGYYNNDEATADAFDGDWFKTGDVANYDEQGMFYLIGRSKELIKVEGVSISPVQLEAVLLNHPGIEDAGVVGVPDDVTGEKAVAFIVPKMGVKVDPDEVCAFVASQVSPHKKLSEAIVTDSIPRNTSGKMLKNILKEQYILTRSRTG